MSTPCRLAPDCRATRRLPAALAATALGAGFLAPASSARVHTTLRYLAVQTSSHGIDRAPKGFGPGDGFSFTEKLLVRRGVAGSDRIRCDVLPRTQFSCRGRFFFREGTITVRGVTAPSDGASSTPVTGGTGLFRGQRGTLRIAPAPHDNSRLRFILR